MLFDFLLKLVTPNSIITLVVSIVLAIMMLAGYFAYVGYVSEALIVPMFLILTCAFVAIASGIKVHKSLKKGSKKK